MIQFILFFCIRNSCEKSVFPALLEKLQMFKKNLNPNLKYATFR